MSLGKALFDLGSGVASFFGTPLAGLAVQAVGSAFGVKGEPTEAKILKQMKGMDPEIVKAKLKEVENQINADKEKYLAFMRLQSIDAKSEHWFQRNARPFLIWCFGSICLSMAIVAMMVATAKIFGVKVNISDVTDLYRDLAIPLGFLGGAVGIYTNGRTKEKIGGVQGKSVIQQVKDIL